MANEKIKIDLEVGGLDQLDASIGNVRALKKELRNWEAGTEQFQQITTTINEMNKEIKSSKLGAESFTEVLGKIPGPVGEIGDKVSGTVNILKLFSGIKLDDLKNSFSVLGSEIGSIGKGFGELTGITKIYTFLNEGLSKSFFGVAVGETAAAGAAGVLTAAIAATGIGALVIGLTLAYEGLKEFVTGEEAAKAATEAVNRELESQNDLLELNAKSTSNANKVHIAEMKARGASEADIRKQQIKDAYNDYDAAFKAEAEAVKLFNDGIKKADDATAKKLQENLDKRKQATKDAYANYLVIGNDAKATELKEQQTHDDKINAANKAANAKFIAEKKATQEEINKIVEQGYEATLADRDKDIYAEGVKYNDLLTKAKKYGLDTTALTESHRMAEKSINDKWDKKDKDDADKKAKELLDKKKKDLKDAFDLEKSELDLQHEKGYLSEKTYIDKLYKLKVKYAEGSTDLNNAEIERVKGLETVRKQDEEDAKKYADHQKEINKAIAQSWVDLGTTIGSSFAELANLFEKGSAASKAFGVISVLINAATSIGKINMAFADSIAEQTKTISLATATVEQGALFASNPFTAVLGAEMIAVGTGVGSTASSQLALLTATKTAQEAAVVISSGAQIAAILSASGTGGSAQAGSSGTAGGLSAPTYSGGPKATATPQIQAPSTNASNPATQIGQSLQNANSQPIRAYVVSGDISTQQQLDRKVNRGATFGLG